MEDVSVGGSPSIRVLLIDDMKLIGKAVGRMLEGEPDIAFHYLDDGLRAIETAASFEPTVILQDLVMPDVDGLQLIDAFRANPSTRDTPLIMLSAEEDPKTKADAFARGANDYVVKLPDRIELLARIRHHSKGFINLKERNLAYHELAAKEKALAEDVAHASKYVCSLLPPPLKKGEIRADWRFIPSATLGGDTFGYHWLDDDHFVLFLLDVSGHGIRPALLAVSALNAIRSKSLPDTDFRDPSQVVAALNLAFQMEQQNNLYFTIWYGVYHKPTGRLDFSGGGHPPALLVSNGKPAEELHPKGPMVGAFEDIEFAVSTVTLDGPARLFLFSDGAYEIERNDEKKSMWPFDEFAKFVSEATLGGKPVMDDLIALGRELQGREQFVDDVSIVDFQFDAPVAKT